MIDEILTFLTQNWQNIIVALSVGFIFYILSTYLLKKYVTSAGKERVKRAKDSLLTILESRVINKQEISLEKINNLLKAIEREHSVILSDSVSSSSILQDLELEFEKSHHLDPNQKEEYCTLIQNQIQEIRASEDALNIPPKYSEILENLEENIKSKNTDKSLEFIKLLKKKLDNREDSIYDEPNGIIVLLTLAIIIAILLKSEPYFAFIFLYLSIVIFAMYRVIILNKK